MTTTTRTAPAARPALRVQRLPPAAEAVVVLLHGGRSQDRTPPRPWGLTSLRMIPFAHSLRAATGGGRLALARVRYRYRGWNGHDADAARDAVRALGELAERTGGLPVVLLGHSMGGRAALWAAGHPNVTGVVALAPWCPLEDPVDQLRGRRSVLLHCPTDRITDARGSWELTHRARSAGAAACGIVMPHGGHGMIRDASAWHRLATRLALGLAGRTALPPRVSAALDPAAPAERARLTYAEAAGG